MRQFQIHIGGVQRSGKSEVAKRLKAMLEARGMQAVIIDIDETRVGIFGDDKDAPVGSAENQKRQKAAYDAVYHLLIPKVLEVGASTIFTATHSRRATYERAKRMADKFGIALRFILIDAPTFEEATKRSLDDTRSLSDMKDMLNDPEQRANFERTRSRLQEEYHGFEQSYLRLPQGPPEDMVEAVLRYVVRE